MLSFFARGVGGGVWGGLTKLLTCGCLVERTTAASQEPKAHTQSAPAAAAAGRAN